jgi:hypothetical protein
LVIDVCQEPEGRRRTVSLCAPTGGVRFAGGEVLDTVQPATRSAREINVIAELHDSLDPGISWLSASVSRQAAWSTLVQPPCGSGDGPACLTTSCTFFPSEVAGELPIAGRHARS